MTTLILPDGQEIEYEVIEHPHRYIDIHLSIDGWLQTFSLDSVIDAWWLAQKRKQERGAQLEREPEKWVVPDDIRKIGELIANAKREL